MSVKKPGFLIVNLGTPAAPEPKALKAYLTEFLMDPYVIDLPWLLRWILVKLIIVPRRSHESAKLYQNIWSDAGSPLLAYSEKFLAKLQDAMPEAPIALAMRYGQPSIQEGLKALVAQGADEIFVLPSYPQYARSSTLTCLSECQRVAQKLSLATPLFYYQEFFNHPGYIASLAATISETIGQHQPDYLLFSYHGIPEHHLTKDSPECRFADACCSRYQSHNPHCYRAQCFLTTKETVRQLGDQLQIPYGVSFQSRLGRRPWLSPNTEEVIAELGRKGHKTLAIACPSFTADCLETLEEISIRAQEVFAEHGGDQVVLVPSLNDRSDWVTACRDLLLSQKADAQPLSSITN